MLYPQEILATRALGARNELERYKRKEHSQVRGQLYNSAICPLRSTKICASDPPSHWWPGER
jgi:hypothetical protein